MLNRRNGLVLLLPTFLLAFAASAEPFGIGTVYVAHPVVQLNDENNASATIRYQCTSALTCDLILYDRTPSEVRTLFAAKHHEPGIYEATWRGRDDSDNPVRNGYYFIKMIGRPSGAILFDSASTDWGHTIVAEDLFASRDAKIMYKLSQNAVVHVGLGHEGTGGYFRTLVDWKARPKGRHVETWDGYDASGKVCLIDRSNTLVQVVAYSLPEQTVIVTGSRTETLPVKKEDSEYIVPSARNTNQIEDISIYARQADVLCRTPLFAIEAVDQKGAAFDLDRSFLSVPVVIRIKPDSETKKALLFEPYKIAVFIDDSLVHEGEESCDDFAFWLYPKQFSSGAHVLNVNVIRDLGAHVGAAMTRFCVAEEGVRDSGGR